MKRFLLSVCLVLGWLCAVHGQLETSKWYFGTQAGLDFSTGVPIPISTSVMTAGEGSASMADASGTLLFYTNGAIIWNRNNVTMANGTGLNGSNISAQSAVIVQRPGSTTQYYVFTMRDWASALNGAHYSLVDMSLNAGLGGVTATKNILMDVESRESLTAVCHANGTDYWIVVHDRTTNNFRTYLLTAAGVNPVPVVSAVGSVFSGGNRYGCLKASPDGTRIAYAMGGSGTLAPTTELYDFNRSTGVVSNPVTLNVNGSLSDAFGLEFSSNSNVLYVCAFNQSVIQQYDLLAGSPAAIVASRQIIASGGNVKANLQLALDGKIYVSINNQAFLGVINSPNTLGSGCTYINGAVVLAPGSNCRLGLPNFVSCILPIVLPVEWSYFEAGAEGEGVGLDWKVAGEKVGLEDFVVERKRVGKDMYFDRLKDAVVRGDTSGYWAFDKSPGAGENQYRIGIVNANGRTHYSEVRTVQFKYGAYVLRAWPNPAGSGELVRVGLGGYAGEVDVRVTNAAGQVVYERAKVSVDGALALHERAAEAGVYMVGVGMKGTWRWGRVVW